MRCARCGEYLVSEDFRRLRSGKAAGVCRACEYLGKYQAEIAEREKRRAELIVAAQENRRRFLPDD